MVLKTMSQRMDVWMRGMQMNAWSGGVDCGVAVRVDPQSSIGPFLAMCLGTRLTGCPPVVWQWLSVHFCGVFGMFWWCQAVLTTHT